MECLEEWVRTVTPSARGELLTIDDRYFLFALITVLSNRMQTIGDTLFDEVTWKQWFVLLGTTVFKQPPSITQVAEVIGTSHQNTKQLLLRLEQVGLVTLETDPTDRRWLLVQLTPKYTAFEQKYHSESEAHITAIYQGIDPKDVSAARRVLEQMEQNIIREADK